MLILTTCRPIAVLLLACSFVACKSDDDHNAGPSQSNLPTGHTVNLTQGDHEVRLQFESGALAGTLVQYSIDYDALVSVSIPEQLGTRQTIVWPEGNYPFSFTFTVQDGQALPFDADLATIYFNIQVLDNEQQSLHNYIMESGDVTISQFSHLPLTSFMGYGSYVATFDAQFIDIQDPELPNVRASGQFEIKRR